MRAARWTVPLVAALGLAGAAGCDEFVYPCHSDANCVVLGAQGRCISAGSAAYCAFPYQELSNPSNPSAAPLYCPSGLRWDTSAPEEIQGSCVVLPPTDGGAGKDGP
jgi:hypothetical protein